MPKTKEIARVCSQREIAKDIFDMWIETSLAKDARPGQFISVYTKDKSKLLPRPISICEIDKEKGRLRIVYRIAGAGTREFSTYKEGEDISVLGTLGNGFPLEETAGKRVMLIGGGIGVPPMLQTAKELSDRGITPTIVLGYRDKNLFLKEDFDKYGKVYIATDNGDVGTHGTVIDAIRANNLDTDLIFACGPMPMLRALDTYAGEHSIKAYVSLEERMACGVGACLGCIVKTKEVDHHSHVNNARICTDGPVYLSTMIDWAK